jgi:hypothetical protein
MRYVIKHPTEGYFTHFEISKTVPILAPMDMQPQPGQMVKKGDQIGTENHCLPKFEAFKPSQASQFDTKQDAENQIANITENHGGPEVFTGCVVVPSPGPGESLLTHTS